MKEYIPGCTGKIPYFSEGEARSAIRRWKNPLSGNPRVYHCKSNDWDNHWHITTKGLVKKKNG